MSSRLQGMSDGSPLKQHAQQQHLQAHKDEMQGGQQRLLSVQHLHLLLGLTPMELLQLSIVVSRAPPPLLCKAPHGPTQLHITGKTVQVNLGQARTANKLCACWS